MRRAIAIAAALASGLVLTMASLPASAAGEPHIEDPIGDANFINDQGTGDGSMSFTQADAGTVSDLIEVTFSNDAKNLYVEIRTEAAPPALTAVGYRVGANPDGPAGARCLFFEAFYPGANNILTAPVAQFRDACGGETMEVKVLGTTIEVPRSAHEAFGKGATLTAPQAWSFLYSGTYPQGVSGPMVDTTVAGRDFEFVDKKKKKKK